MTKITAHNILDLLATRHSEDVFVPECKSGPTWNGPHLRMDAWAMKRSWARPVVWGYEIKVSRADFLKDDKWPQYLPYCNEFYFVTVPGVCEKAELPEHVGLLVTSANGSRLMTKRKAVYRDVTISEDLWRYLLICRTKVTKENSSQDRADFWAEWLRRKGELKDVGWRVSRRLKDLVDEQITKVELENKKLEAQNKDYEDIKKTLLQLGIQPGTYEAKAYRVSQKVRELQRVVPPHLKHCLQNAEKDIHTLISQLEELEKDAA